MTDNLSTLTGMQGSFNVTVDPVLRATSPNPSRQLVSMIFTSEAIDLDPELTFDLTLYKDKIRMTPHEVAADTYEGQADSYSRAKCVLLINPETKHVELRPLDFNINLTRKSGQGQFCAPRLTNDDVEGQSESVQAEASKVKTEASQTRAAAVQARAGPINTIKPKTTKAKVAKSKQPPPNKLISKFAALQKQAIYQRTNTSLDPEPVARRPSTKINYQSLHYKSEQNYKQDQINKAKLKREEEKKMALAAKTEKSKVAKSKGKTTTRPRYPSPQPASSSSNQTKKTITTPTVPENELATDEVKQDPKDNEVVTALELAMEEETDAECDDDSDVDEDLLNDITSGLEAEARAGHTFSQTGAACDNDSDVDEDLLNDITSGLETENTSNQTYAKCDDDSDVDKDLLNDIMDDLEKEADTEKISSQVAKQGSTQAEPIEIESDSETEQQESETEQESENEQGSEDEQESETEADSENESESEN